MDFNGLSCFFINRSSRSQVPTLASLVALGWRPAPQLGELLALEAAPRLALRDQGRRRSQSQAAEPIEVPPQTLRPGAGLCRRRRQVLALLLGQLAVAGGGGARRGRA